MISVMTCTTGEDEVGAAVDGPGRVAGNAVDALDTMILVRDLKHHRGLKH